MAWPVSQDYNEAIQAPHTSFADPELRQARAVTNTLAIPLPRSGSFADVYEVCSADGRTRWAVKCFTRQVVGLRERYSEISKYLRQAQLPFMVDFQYLEQGIRVRGAWYPVLKMHWVEGLLLHEFVRDNIDKPVLLKGLEQIWLRLARKLREAKVAHCDLQHGNIILVPGSTATSLAVKLIDYDGMFVPALAGTRSGEVGHPSYQHPQRFQTGAYHAEVDRFPLLLIATALHGLAVCGRSLWERHHNGDNLLFRQADLKNPAQSPLFAELRQVRDPLLQTLVTQLQQACAQPLEKAPLLETLYPEERTAPRPSAARAPVAKAAPAPAAVWDFRAPAGDASRVRRRRRRASGWAWALGGGAIVLLILLGAAGAFWMLLNGPPTPLAQLPRATTGKKTSEPLAEVKPPGQEEVQETNPPGKEKKKPEKSPVPAPLDSPPGHRLQAISAHGSSLLAWAGPEERSWHLKEISSKRAFPPFQGHRAAVTCIAFCPDGKHVLTGSADHTLRLWDVADGQGTIHTLEGHTRPVTCVAVSPDGRLAASADGGADVLLWDLDAGRRIRTLDNPRAVRALGFSDDGRKVLCGLDRPAPSDREAVCCTLHSVLPPDGAARRPGVIQIAMDQAVTAVARSSDGQRVVLGGDSMLWVIEVRRKGAEPGTLSVQPRRLGPSPGTVHRIVFSRDGRRFLASAQKAAYLFGVESAPLLVKSPRDPDHVCACFSQDEKQMLLARQYGGDADIELAPLPDRAEASLDPSRNKP